jgi:UDP-3-O-[3-hydroxymyristoyl] glucosamine N-acyltransferase
MKLIPPKRVAELAEILGCSFVGPGSLLVSGINEIHRVVPGDLTFVDVEKYYKKALSSAATTILINKAIDPPEGKALLVTDDPFRDFNRLNEHFRPRIPSNTSEYPKLHPSVRMGHHVVLGEGVRVGSNVEIGHNVVIGSHVSIGSGSIILPNVYIGDYTEIGERVCIQPGAVIGGEAFYFKKRPEGRDKMLTKGHVILESDVEIGANTTIDRGVTDVTFVGRHTKIDNLVQIGHDTRIGRNCVIAAQVGIAGVTTIEDDCILWGQSGVPSDIVVGKGTILLAKSGLLSSVEGGKVYFGMVAKEYRQMWRELSALEHLPELLRRVEHLLTQPAPPPAS